MTVDPKRRPYVIIDPRAGHGPGIGGFKDDSQVGVALEDGHPVYFVIFFPAPEPGQTLLDVCDAERQFVRVVRERHPDSAAPVVIGNCQGGWAAMMLAAAAPEDTGPIVINGAPMSYWGGAWSEGEGDNITPPQQAFNWIADLYGSTEEIKARGQVIVGLVHQDVGHLGIFVSGRVARKEHKQIVSVLKSVEALPPGLWGMEVEEAPGAGGKPVYDVSFTEHALEDVVQRMNRFEREDEKAFEAVAAISEFNQRAYELFARPLVRALTDETAAEFARAFHPLRAQRWSFSDLNPFLWWLKPAAAAVTAARLPAAHGNSLRKVEKLVSEGVSASLDLYRGMRDAGSEALFFTVYGNIFAFHMEEHGDADRRLAAVEDPRGLPWVSDALAGIDKGGYPAALSRAAFLLQHKGVPIPLSRIELKAAFLEQNADLLPDLPLDEMRRIRGQQELIVNYEPERALQTLPALLGDPQDRSRFLTVLQRVAGDPNLPELVPEQIAMFDRIRTVLAPTPSGTPAPRKPHMRRAAKASA